MARAQSLKQSLPGLWRIFSYFWPQVRKHRALIAGSTAALFAEIVLRLLEPWPLKFIFDRVLSGDETGAPEAPAFVNSLDSATLLIVAAVAVVVITSLRALVSFQTSIGFATVGNRVLTKVRNQLYQHVQYLSLSFHTRARTGDTVVRVINDVGMLQDVAVTALMPLLAKALLVVGMIALMFWMNWQLAFIAVSVLPLFWLRTVRLTQRIRDVARKQREQQGAMAAAATEVIHGIRTVQALALEEAFGRVFTAQGERMLKNEVKAKRLAAALERSVDVLVALATALVLWFGARLVLREAITAGDLLIFLAYLKYAYRPVQDFAKYTGRLAKATAAGDRVLELLERVPDVRDLPGAVQAPEFHGAVRLENVSFAYEHGQHLLEGISLDVQAGQRVALVGPSGGGKTTLVSLILRLYDPNEGRVLVDGRDIREYTLESLRSQMSVVLQDNLLFAASVKANIAHGAPHAGIAEIEAAARLANAHEFITALPAGYETVIGERGVTLSQGQRQRIAIARAAIRKAPVLILDEPTTGLDKQNERMVLEALERLYLRRTTFIITHDLHQAVSADVILFLDEGRILERGTHAELLAAASRYASLYQLQAASRDEGEKVNALAR